MLHEQLGYSSIATATEAACAAVAGDSHVVNLDKPNPVLVALRGVSANCQYIRVRKPENPTGVYQPGDVAATIKVNGGLDKITPVPLTPGSTLNVFGYQDSGGAESVGAIHVVKYGTKAGVSSSSVRGKDGITYRAAAPTATVAATWTRIAANIFATAGFELKQGHRYAIVRAGCYAATTIAARMECPEWEGLLPPAATTTDVAKHNHFDFRDFDDLPTFTYPSPVHFWAFDTAGTTNPVILVEVAEL